MIVGFDRGQPVALAAALRARQLLGIPAIQGSVPPGPDVVVVRPELAPEWAEWWTVLVTAYGGDRGPAELEQPPAGLLLPTTELLAAAVGPVARDLAAWAATWRLDVLKRRTPHLPQGLLALALDPGQPAVRRALRARLGSRPADQLNIAVVPAEGAWGVLARPDVLLVSPAVGFDRTVAADWLGLS